MCGCLLISALLLRHATLPFPLSSAKGSMVSSTRAQRPIGERTSVSLGRAIGLLESGDGGNLRYRFRPRAFSSASRPGTEPLVTGEHARMVTEDYQAADQSAESGLPVDIAPSAALTTAAASRRVG